MGVGALVRRWASDPTTAVATVLTVALSMVLLAAGPIYSDAVAVGSIRQSVTAAAGSTDIEVATILAPDDFTAADAYVRGEVGRAVRPLPPALSWSIVSGESFALPDQVDLADGERVDLVEFVAVESFEEHAAIVDGTWPDAGGRPHQVLVDERLASAFALTVGDELELEPRAGAADPAVVVVAGTYRLDDPFEPFWSGRPEVSEPVSVSSSFRTGRFLVAPESLLDGLSGRVSATWLSLPAFDELEPGDVTPIRRRVSRLEDRLNGGASSASLETAAAFDVTTTVPNVLAGSGRSLTVARSAVLAVLLQLALLAGYALVLVAGLNVDARRAESAMFRARGAGSGQLLGTAVFESLVLVVPLAAVAPWLAAWGLRWFDEFGPLASIGLTIEPRPVGSAYVAVAIAAVVVVVLLSLPAYRAARAAEMAEHRHRRQRLTSAAQRAGVDLALLFVSGLAFWQLATLGDERAASVRGRFGIDPLLIVAPTFGLIAGSFLAIRVIPLLARLAERRVAGARSVVPALSGWQFARRPTRYGRSGLLLIMAVAIGTFTVTYEATWTRSQRDQADQQVGADARVTPNRRTNDSASDLVLIGLHEQLVEVDRSIPVRIHAAGLPGGDDAARLLALDAARAAFRSSRSDADARIGRALADLAAERSALPGLVLPGQPVTLDLPVRVVDPTYEASLEPPGDDAGSGGDGDGGDDGDGQGGATEPPPGPPIQPFRGSVVLVLQDGFGLLHRIDVGSATVDGGNVPVDLAVTAADGALVTPEYPLALVDVEIQSGAPPPPSRTVRVEVDPLVIVDADGTRTDVDLAEQVSTSAEPFGFLGERASVDLAADQPDEGVGLQIETGSAGFRAVPVTYRLSPSGARPPSQVPAIVTSGWSEANQVDVDDELAVSFGRAEPVRVRVAGVVESIPTIDPSTTAGVLVDLATLQASIYADDHTVAEMTEYWLAVDGAVPTVALTSTPIESVDVVVREQRRAELVSDPPALGAIGALTLGFIAAAVFAIVGFVITTVISARERRLEFALVRALGLTMRQLRRWMLIEQVTLVVAGVVAGTAIGVGLSALVLPLVSLTQRGGDVVPSVIVTYPWGTIALLQTSLLVGLAAASSIVNAMIRRMVVGTALRAGSEA